jgi:hypothetical protein
MRPTRNSVEMSACANRVVVVTVTNSNGTQVRKIPRLSKSNLADLSASPANEQ